MKKFNCILFILLLISVKFISALEVGTLFHIGNLGFHNNSGAWTSSDTTISGTKYPWGVSVFGNQKATDTIKVDLGFYYDPILRNISYTRLSYTEEFFTIDVGPFFGFFNTPASVLKSGISTSFKLEYPGIIFLSFRTDSSIGGRLVQAGDYLQERNDVTIGYYVPNSICSLNLLTKNFTLKTDSGEIVDKFTGYSFKADIFQKNVPYRIILSFDYQILSKIFVEDSVTTTHTLNSLVLGTELNFQINEFITFVTNVESNIYSFGFSGDELLVLADTWPGIFMFRLSTGVTLNFDNFKSVNID